MALSIGELVGFVDLDTKAAETGATKLDTVLQSAGKVWANTLGKAGKSAGAAAADSMQSAAKSGLAGMDTKLVDGAVGNLMTALPQTVKGAVDRSSVEFKALSPALRKAVTDAEAQAKFDKLPTEVKAAMAEAERQVAVGGKGMADEAAEAGEDAGESMGAGFKSKAKLGALAAAGAFSASLAMAISGEPAKDKLVAQLGLTGKESKRIGKVAGGLFANAYGDSMEDVNDAVSAVYRNIDGMSTASSKDLTKVTASVMDVANAFDQDLAMTTAAVGTMMRTGMAKDATDALDIITKGLQGPANKADDLLETFNEYSTQFRKLGIDGKDALGLMSQGLEGGARDADVVADALKEFSIRSVEALETMDSKGRPQLTALGQAFQNVLPPTMDMYDAQEKLAKGGKGARNMLGLMLDGLRKIEDPTTRSMDAVALFGTQAEDLGASLYSLDLDTAAKGVGKIGGAAEKMGKTLNDNASANIESFKRKAQTAFVNVLGGQVLPIVTELSSVFAVGLGPAVSKVVGFLSKHTTTAKVLAGVLAGLVAVTAAHSAVMSVSAAGGMAKWLMQTKLITTATKVWTAVQWALSAAMNASPLGLIVVGLAALAVGLVLAYKKSETFRKIVDGAFDGVKKTITTVADFITKTIPKAMDWVVDKGKQWGPYLLAAVVPIVGVPLLIAKHWDTIKSKTSSLIDTTVSWFRALPGKIGNGLASLGSTVVTKFGDAMTAGKDKAVSIGSSILDFYLGLPGKIRTRLNDMIGVVRGIMSDAMVAGRDRVYTVAGSILDFYLGLPGRIRSRLNDVIGVVRGLFADAMNAGKDKVVGIGGTIRDWIADIPNKLSSLGGRFGSAGRGLLQDFINGMRNAAGIISGIAGSVWSTVRGLLNGAIGKINAALEFKISLPLGKSVSINPPDIPMLATGGRATAATLAVIGEGREPESVLPDSVLRGLLERAHDAGRASRGPDDNGGAPRGPLIGTVQQAPGESAENLAERLWFMTHTRG